ncbi:MAG: hypothetical protein K2O72_05815 [Ligilactobacillus sp.]|nr:hypothetical protein [Ligilactobacillus sp.]
MGLICIMEQSRKVIENVNVGDFYSVGERTPYFDNQIRGCFIRIDTWHTLEHFERAILEGIIFLLNAQQSTGLPHLLMYQAFCILW